MISLPSAELNIGSISNVGLAVYEMSSNAMQKSHRAPIHIISIFMRPWEAGGLAYELKNEVRSNSLWLERWLSGESPSCSSEKLGPLRTTCNTSSWGSDAVFWPPHASGTHMVDLHTSKQVIHTHTHTSFKN